MPGRLRNKCALGAPLSRARSRFDRLVDTPQNDKEFGV
jgi:hypothetical protein